MNERETCDGETKRTMTAGEALRPLASRRTTEIVVTTMGGTREWSQLSDSPLDLHYLPSAMGHAPMIALGLALACPQREVLVLNGDGSLLMSLGCLVTIAACRPPNLSVIVLDNGVYEVTGGQATAGAQAGVDFVAVARGAGFDTAVGYCDPRDWEGAVAMFFRAPAPRFAVLRVAPVEQDYVPRLRAPLPERLAQFRAAIAGVMRG